MAFMRITENKYWSINPVTWPDRCHPLQRKPPLPVRVCLSAACLLLTLLLASCYDPNPVNQMAVSPDGHYLAMINLDGQLDVVDLVQDAPLVVYTHHARRGLSWSPDSKFLVFVEEFPSQASSLVLLNIQTGRREKPLVENSAWKADPQWIGPGLVAFLSDHQSDHVSVWTVDVNSRYDQRIIDRGQDFTRLWGEAARGSLIAEGINGDALGLSLWRRDADEPVTLTSAYLELGDWPQQVVFDRSGRHAAFIEMHGDRRWLNWYDLENQNKIAELPLTKSPNSLSVLDDGRIGLCVDNRLLLWQQNSRWFERELRERLWHGVPLGCIAPLPRGGAALMANANVLLLAADADNLLAAKVLSRNTSDMIALARTQAEMRYPGEAKEILDDVWENVAHGSRNQYLVAMAQARLQRMQGRPRRAGDWLTEALANIRPDSPDAQAAWFERLNTMAFDIKNINATLSLR